MDLALDRRPLDSLLLPGLQAPGPPPAVLATELHVTRWVTFPSHPTQNLIISRPYCRAVIPPFNNNWQHESIS